MNDLKGECGLLLLLMLMCGGNKVLCSRLWREVLCMSMGGEVVWVQEKEGKEQPTTEKYYLYECGCGCVCDGRSGGNVSPL